MARLLQIAAVSLAALCSTAWSQSFGPNFFWTDGVIPYHIVTDDTDGEVSPFNRTTSNTLCVLTKPGGTNACGNQANVIREAIERLERSTPLEFKEELSPCPENRERWECLEFFVQLQPDGNGGFTNQATGAWGGPERVNVGGSGPGVTTHEIVHGLGFRHQFARADARDYINVYEACGPLIAGNLDSPQGTQDEHRRLYGPGEFGGYRQSNSSVPVNSISTLPHVPLLDSLDPDPTRWPSSLMAYASHKARGPMQACFKRCTGTLADGECQKDGNGNEMVAEVRRPWDIAGVEGNSWRFWSCNAGYNTPGMPANVRGCADDPDALASCQLCRASSAFGKTPNQLAMAFELKVPPNQDDERIYFRENRRTFTWLDRSKITRRAEEALVNDVLAVDREAVNGRYTELRPGPSRAVITNPPELPLPVGRTLLSGRKLPPRPSGRATVFQPLFGGVDIVRVGHMNNDYYSDIVNYEPSSGKLRVRLTTNQPSVRSLPIVTTMKKGYTDLVLGWFETGELPTHENLFDSEQDIFAYDKTSGKAEIGRLDFDARRKFWRYTTVCTANLDTGYDRVIAGNFDKENWNTSLAMVSGLDNPQTRIDILAPVASDACLVKKGQFFTSGGPWTEVTPLEHKLFGCDQLKNSDRSKCNNGSQDTDGDQMTDLLFYNRDTGKAKVMKRSNSENINFSAAAQPTSLPKGFSQIVSMDYDHDSRGDLLALRRNTQQIQRFKGTPTGFTPSVNVALTTDGFDIWQLFTGHFPNGKRPSDERVCGNALREPGELCDMDQLPQNNSCKSGEVPMCSPDCLSIRCQLSLSVAPLPN